MSDAPRYITLRDYLRVLREQRVIIVLITLVFAGVALAYSVRQTAVYQADAQVAYQDPAADQTIVGAAGFPEITADQRALLNAELISTPRIVNGARRRLNNRYPYARLAGMISTHVEVRTDLVVISAKSSDPPAAAAVANAFAQQAVAAATADARGRFASAAASIRRTLRGRRNVDPFQRAQQLDRANQLDAAAHLSHPAAVVRAATVPSTPVAPRPIRNTVLGLIIGLTLGILAAFVRDSLDVRLRGSREIQEHYALPLLGHVSSDALGSAGLASSNGRPTSAPDLEAFRILRTNLQFLDVDNPPRAILVTSALPEEGKSTVAASLAAASAAAGKRTLLVECDLRRPSLAERVGLAPAPGLTDYLAGQAEPRDLLQTLPLGPAPTTNGSDADAADDGRPRLVCILAGSPTPRPAELLGSERFAGFLEQVTDAYEVVVLDSSPLLSVVDTLELLPHVDAVLVCVRASRTTRDQAHAAKAALEHFPSKPTGLVVTGIRPGDEIDYGYYYSYTGDQA